MAITIDWQSQRISQGYDSCCKHHHWSTDAGRLDEIKKGQLVTMLGSNRGLLPSGNTGPQLEKTETV